mmetsp:Transcript_44140/g.42857  ORF Transcript_44140/g.42857 Transcript_44140/m.42857 type:complete len:277 (+) Transcript_44140:280-1110(+)
MGPDEAVSEGEADLVEDEEADDQVVVVLVPHDDQRQQRQRQVHHELQRIVLRILLHRVLTPINDADYAHNGGEDGDAREDQEEGDAEGVEVLDGVEEVHHEVEQQQQVQRNEPRIEHKQHVQILLGRLAGELQEQQIEGVEAGVEGVDLVLAADALFVDGLLQVLGAVLRDRVGPAQLVLLLHLLLLHLGLIDIWRNLALVLGLGPADRLVVDFRVLVEIGKAVRDVIPPLDRKVLSPLLQLVDLDVLLVHKHLIHLQFLGKVLDLFLGFELLFFV